MKTAATIVIRPADSRGSSKTNSSADDRQVEELRAVGEVGPGEEFVLDHLLGELGMDLDPGRGIVDRRAADVLEADGAGADEDDVAVELVRRHLVLEHGARRDEALVAMTAVVERQAAARVGARLDLAGLDGDDPGLGAERQLAARAGRLDQVGAGALGDPQRLDRQRGKQALLPGHAEQHRHAADHRRCRYRCSRCRCPWRRPRAARAASPCPAAPAGTGWDRRRRRPCRTCASAAASRPAGRSRSPARRASAPWRRPGPDRCPGSPPRASARSRDRYRRRGRAPCG